MNDFEYDVMQRKRVAAGARHRKCGSKSRKCSLSTDHMTDKQWRERCGDIVEYQLAEPMAWNAFKALPPDIQKMYVDRIIEKYHATASDLSKVFGATSQTITKHLQQFGISFSPGKKMPKDLVDEFNAFLHKADRVDDVDEDGTSVIEIAKEQKLVPAVTPCVEMKRSGMTMTDFSLSFYGKYTPEMIHNSIAAMLPEGSDVSIEIRCCILKSA